MNGQHAYYEHKLFYEIDSFDLFEALEKGEKIIVVDTRSSESYKREHIPGSINIPHRTMSSESTSGLNKESLYVCYCDGIGCNASTKGALNMLKLGFKVKELIGGLEWWKKDGYETNGNNANIGTKINCAC